MNKKRLAFLVCALVLFSASIAVLANAQYWDAGSSSGEEGIITSLLSIFKGDENLVAVYQTYSVVIDAIILCILFVGICLFALRERLGAQTNMVAIVLGIAFGIGGAITYKQIDTSGQGLLFFLGPIGLMILMFAVGFVVFMIIHNLLHAGTVTSAAWAYIITYMLLSGPLKTLMTKFLGGG